MSKFAAFLAAVLALCHQGALAADRPSETNWYTRSFFLLHLDHHTTDKMAVGRDADPVETARLINLVKPDVIQIHAKGAPGWTTYPTTIGHAPSQLARDVLRVWTDIARGQHYTFSAYYNIGRDQEAIRRHPEWGRIQPNGTPYDNMLCYHSGVAEQYLWPMIDEIMDRYRPNGFWLDGSSFTVMSCYCNQCREKFRQEHQLDAPIKASQPGWADYKEMQRQIYREFCAQTAARIKQRDPNCVVAFNWAFSLRMPEEPPPGVDYFTGDHGDQVDHLAPDAIWYDSQNKPFDLMTTVFYRDAHGLQLKPRLQLEQEMGIILAHGGRYFAWDNPTPESGLVLPRYEMMARVVTPFLRARQFWCLGSRSLPEISLFHGAAAHYAQRASSVVAFPRDNPPLLNACEGLRRLHLAPEMISDRRLEQGDIHSRLLLEDTAALTAANRHALRRYVENGGRVLLTGQAVVAAQLVDTQATGGAGLQRQALGKGEVCLLSQPLFTRVTEDVHRLDPAKKILRQMLPPTERLITFDGPNTVEVTLREKDGARILHLVNIAPGERERDPQAKASMNLHLRGLPPAPPSRITLHLPQRPDSITLQPQNKVLHAWTWHAGQLQLDLPSFETHQMVIISPPGK